MRTTVTIDDHLLDEVRRRAADQRKTVSQVIEDSLREALLRHRETDRAPFGVRTFDGGRPQPGVDLDDNAGVLEVMDGR